MGSLWQSEYAEFVLEGTPGRPYENFNIVEHNMNFRRRELESLLQPDEVLLTLSNFPRYLFYYFTLFVKQYYEIYISDLLCKSHI